MKKKTIISDKSVDSAGIPKDYKQSIAELIWNGFDAKASKIDIQFTPNEVDHIDTVTISDNGEGINYGTIEDSFGSFLDSMKKNTFQRSSFNRGKKGKGRYSFSTFSAKAQWHTTYQHENKLLEYDIIIKKNSKDEYEVLNQKVSKRPSTGTDVILYDLFEVNGFSFTCDEFKDFLAKEFGWFLYLNRDLGYSLEINGVPIQYEHLIPDSETMHFIIKNDEMKEQRFQITYLRWSVSIGDKYYFYFLNSEKKEIRKSLTSYNNNAIEFHHSVYVESDFFDDLDLNTESQEEENFFSQTDNAKVYKSLMKKLNEFLFSKQKDFIRGNAAQELVLKLETKGSFPKFANNKYDLERKKDLINVVKELYCIQPKVFKGLKKEQEQTFLGFLNLLLDTDERENILQIIESVVNLTPQEREDFSVILKKSSFSRILSTVKLIENRYKTIELLKTLVFDLKKFTTERDHIQIAIEENYWLFGEQYHLASADQHFQHLLSSYLYIIDEQTKPQQIKAFDWKRRPDIFMCRKNTIPDTLYSEYNIEENIIVELKRPSVVIGKDQYRQIDDYLDFIVKEDQFNSETRRWKFFVISNKIDNYIQDQYEAFKDKGKKFLIKQSGKYEMYAMTWDDVFRTFEIKHGYLLDKLEFDKQAIREELNLKGIILNNSGSDYITSNIVKISSL